jgi:hypothetical protein|tara:strand:- start:23751 stop:24119 length:369 start_codon:yes stop_codon:yes gene_type:complete
MNLHTYKAVVARLRADGLDAAARINLLLNQQSGVPGHGETVGEICTAMRRLTESEGALITFQQYFAPTQPVVPPPPPVEEAPDPAAAEEKSLRLTEEELNNRSATFRKSRAKKKTNPKKSDE